MSVSGIYLLGLHGGHSGGAAGLWNVCEALGEVP